MYLSVCQPLLDTDGPSMKPELSGGMGRDSIHTRPRTNRYLGQWLIL